MAEHFQKCWRSQRRWSGTGDYHKIGCDWAGAVSERVKQVSPEPSNNPRTPSAGCDYRCFLHSHLKLQRLRSIESIVAEAASSSRGTGNHSDSQITTNDLYGEPRLTQLSLGQVDVDSDALRLSHWTHPKSRGNA